MYEAFVYCWTDNKTGMLYIGSHKGATDDGYVCSSKTMLHEYYKRPEDFTRQIIAEGSYEDIRKFEYKILDSVNAKHNIAFYNKHNGSGDFYHKFLTEEHKDKIKKTCLERQINKGKRHSEESKELMSKNRKGKAIGPNNYMYGGGKLSNEQIEIMSIKAKNRERKTCEVCGKTMDISNFNRHKHGINCNRGKGII